MTETVLLSIRVALIAVIINTPLAILISYIIERGNFWGKSILEGIVNLPLVMPPVTIGYLLLLLFGKQGVITAMTGIHLSFSFSAVVLAAMIISLPMMVKSIRVSLTMVDINLEFAASTLGANRIHQLLRVTLPQIRTGILNGMFTGFARSLGEFGATMIFAGNLQGVTRTIPLAVYTNLQIPGREREALIYVGISIIVAFSAMVMSNRFEKSGGRYVSRV